MYTCKYINRNSDRERKTKKQKRQIKILKNEAEKDRQTKIPRE